ncbi:MAG: PilZ domain-containing protein [Pseudomonadota bacterium]|nr:PilZ domain-containing protein [Pseudomonadota bacterium]
MVKKPKLFNTITVLLLVLLVAFPVQVMFLYGHYPWEVMPILAKLSILNWLTMIGCGYTAYCSFAAAPQFKIALPLLTVLVAWNNTIVSYVGYDYNVATTLMATVIFASSNMVFFQTEIQLLMAAPHKRWWLNSPRIKVNVPVFISPQRSEGFSTDTFDISTGGTFIPLKSAMATQLSEGESLSLSFKLGAFRTLRCDARVVRHQKAKGAYPDGIGIKFENLNRQQQYTLSQFFRVTAA